MHGHVNVKVHVTVAGNKLDKIVHVIEFLWPKSMMENKYMCVEVRGIGGFAFRSTNYPAFWIIVDNSTSLPQERSCRYYIFRTYFNIIHLSAFMSPKWPLNLPGFTQYPTYFIIPTHITGVDHFISQYFTIPILKNYVHIIRHILLLFTFFCV